MHCPEDKPCYRWKTWLGTAILASLVAVGLTKVTGCGVERETQVVQVPVPTPPPPTTDTGTGTETDTEAPPPACNVDFADVKPVLTSACVRCHQGYDTYAVASDNADDFIRRVNLPASSPAHMPKGGDLKADDKAKLAAWKADGLKEACPGTPPPPPPPRRFDLGYVEGVIFSDLQALDPTEREEVRYLVDVDRLNLGAGTDEQTELVRAANKSLNMVAVDANDPYSVEKVADGVYRVELEDFGLEEADWAVVETADQFQFESFTATGLAIKAATGTRLPWLHLVNFNDLVLRDAKLYYTLTRTPATLAQLAAQLGVDLAGDLKDAKAVFSGFAGSPLNSTSHRLAVRFDSDDGFFWITFDPGVLDAAGKNLFQNPCLAGTGCNAIFQFLASEVFYSLPSGMMASALFNAAGQLQEFAPENVVHDFTTNPLSPTIRNAISCTRCHNGGIIRVVDQIRPTLSGPGSPLNAADAQIALALFRPQAEVDRLVARDNAKVARALQAIGVEPSAADPISTVSDKWLADQTLDDVAALLFYSVEETRVCLNLSAEGRQVAGALLAGGRVTHDQLKRQLVPVVKRDCRWGQDPL